MIRRIREAGKDSVRKLNDAGIQPTLCIFRVGARSEDLAYENTIKRAAARMEVNVATAEFGEDATTEEVLFAVEAASADDSIHGILVFRPMPAQIDEDAVCESVPPGMDVDGVGILPMSLLYKSKTPADIEALKDKTFLPATAEASLAILKEFGIGLAGRRTVVIGRSTVIGKPIAQLLLTEDATVTMAHSKSSGLADISKGAEILIACAGITTQDESGSVVGAIGKEYLSPGQTVIDVGMNPTDSGGLTGDVSVEDADGLVEAITPVPGGVGGVTTQLLLAHVISAAERLTA
jgi:methylenetetrahydrofolate dehydrogenase (NADP+)/methenyltetrahydrofolate cyclohydrolase